MFRFFAESGAKIAFFLSDTLKPATISRPKRYFSENRFLSGGKFLIFEFPFFYFAINKGVYLGFVVYQMRE